MRIDGCEIMYEVEVLDESFLDNPRKRVSINSDAIDVLTMDILEIARKANITLNKITTIVANTSETYKCDSGYLLRKKINNKTQDFTNIIQNIENYAYSLKTIKSKMTLKKDEIIADIQRKSASISAENIKK